MKVRLRDLSPGEDAVVDQTLAFARDVEKAWPHNQNLLNDCEVEHVVLERLAGGWEEMRADRGYLLWANGRMVEVAPNDLSIVSAVRTSMPVLARSECDRCRATGMRLAVAVVAVPRNLVALTLCPGCVATTTPELLTEGA